MEPVEMENVVKDVRDPLTKENILDYSFEKQTTDENGNSITEDHFLSVAICTIIWFTVSDSPTESML
mgnify:CR=1 FL=1